MRQIITALQLLLARLGIFLFARLFPAKYELYRFDIWLLPWLRRRRRPEMLAPPPAEHCRDLLFCFVDHFEPGTQGVDAARSQARFDAWMRGYPEIARRFVDSDGRHPQHGFFFPPHYFSDAYLRGLAGMDWQGLGEVELHLHHEHDNSANLRRTLDETMDLYAGYGVGQCQGDPVRRRYGFIHGNWALDNSRPEYCGVNDELEILQETGCYADFTFPSLHVAQPRMVNALYRSVDDPAAPKSYDTGRHLEAGRRPAPGEFLMVTGPMGLRPRRRFPFFAVEEADVTGEGPGSPERVRGWVGQGIQVQGRPEWTFVKVHTHGAPERHHDALLGEGAERMYRCLCEEYGDGRRWRLHFVNARELANIARAAEDGLAGDAGRFRDYEIPPFLTRDIKAGSTYRARRFLPAATDAEGFALDMTRLRPAESATFAFRLGPLRALRGAFAALRVEREDGGQAEAGRGAMRLELQGVTEPLELLLLPDFGLRDGDGPLTPAGEETLDGRTCRRYLLAPAPSLNLGIHSAETQP